MKWIRMRNKGHLDLPKMLNLFGASVKTSPDCIGQFGDGTRYALALTCRLGINLKICSNGHTYSLMTVPEVFRGKEFQVVCFKTETGKIVRSPVTTELGQFDWLERWSILREFYSNMLDEGGECHITEGFASEDGYVDVFLPYNSFKEEIENIEQYFSGEEAGTLKVGTGRVYKKGVYVGTLKDFKLDMWSNSVKITESRTMDESSGISCIADIMSECTDMVVWQHFLESKRASKCHIYAYSSIEKALDGGMRLAHGENYALCPAVDSILKDCVLEGMNPVVLADTWNFSNCKLQNYLDKIKGIGTRPPNESERVMLCKACKAIEFITGGTPLNISIIVSEELSRLGDANRNTGEIRLAEANFKEYKKLVNTLIHEVSHCPKPLGSGAGDYDRAFTQFFVDKLTDLCT